MRTLDVCLAVLICGDNGISRDPLDVCFGDQLAGSAHEPMHRGWHRFRRDSPVETSGHSVKYFVLVEQMNLRLCDAYHIIMPMDT